MFEFLRKSKAEDVVERHRAAWKRSDWRKTVDHLLQCPLSRLPARSSGTACCEMSASFCVISQFKTFNLVQIAYVE
ncbi:hypothetical protein SAMN05444003_0897 [Cognatiyoonia sediminum]|uniref:Uncharacterized protein n=1 Tax=Cognatiyoonia sediminum TaxID=1508389 RepID=A0A1M5MLC2_9RHOB|nr:hypothetical protein [Cognatiyoonia sediminum]SHG78224.1 hypothetical protein SAMN05444003_0897 [Cognatiyoonia sediminum]